MGNISSFFNDDKPHALSGINELFIIKEGYLLKQSAHLQKWRKRWMILKDKTLLSCKNKLNPEVTETFDLSVYDRIDIIDNISNQFKIISSSQSRLFKASTNPEMLEWIKFIKIAQTTHSNLIQVENKTAVIHVTENNDDVNNYGNKIIENDMKDNDQQNDNDQLSVAEINEIKSENIQIDTNNIMNNEIKDDKKEEEEHEQHAVLCICKRPMIKIMLGVVFGDGAEAECCWCDHEPFNKNDTMYWCSTHNEYPHPYGYFICTQCSLEINNKPWQQKIDKYQSKIEPWIEEQTNLSIEEHTKIEHENMKIEIEMKAIENLIAMNNENEDIIYWSRVSIRMNENIFLLFMVLRENKCLYIYANSQDYKDGETNYIMDLNNYEEVVSYNEFEIATIKMDEYMRIKYGFVLKSQDDKNGALFLFQKNNVRYEWMTHIQYIIMNKNKATIKQEQSDGICKDLNKNMDAVDNVQIENALEQIDMIMNIYHEWNEKDNDKEEGKPPISVILKQKHNINCVGLLNYFNHIIIANRNNDNKIKYKCPKKNDCLFVSRHYKRREIGSQRVSKCVNSDTYDELDDEEEILIELLDKIHFYMYHNNQIQNAPQTIQENATKKFVITTKNDNNTEDDNKDDEKQSYDDVSTFAFGECFAYYDETKDADNFINCQYGSLFEELLLNRYYQLPLQKLNEIYLKAKNIKKTNEFKNITAKGYGQINRWATIDIGDSISINHIISLLIYCNEDALQRIFKKHTRKFSKHETVKEFFKRHSFIAHWTRYLQESCIFYGKLMSLTDIVYCGIDTKLMFDSFCFENHCPLSTSTDIIIANQFATNDGIILKLQRNEERCCYFDMMILSDFIQEKERFFCGATKLKIIDIIVDGNSNENMVTCLKLLECILNGCLFYYEWNKPLFQSESQTQLIKLLNYYINNNTNDNKECDDEYFNQLTSVLINSFINRTYINDPFGLKTLCINSSELEKLNNNLLSSYFQSSASSDSILFSSKPFLDKNIKIRYIGKNVQQFKLKPNQINELKQLDSGNQKTFEIGEFIVDGYQFHFYFQKESKFGKGDHPHLVFWFHLITNSETFINMSLDIVCKEIKYQTIQKYVKITKATNYCAGIWAFSCSTIANLDNLTIDLNMRIFDGVYIEK